AMPRSLGGRSRKESGSGSSRSWRASRMGILAMAGFSAAAGDAAGASCALHTAGAKANIAARGAKRHAAPRFDRARALPNRVVCVPLPPLAIALLSSQQPVIARAVCYYVSLKGYRGAPLSRSPHFTRGLV